MKRVIGSQAVVVHTLIPVLGRQKQADLCEFKASLVYRVSSRTVKATQRSPVLKNKTKQTNKQKNQTKQMKTSTTTNKIPTIC